MADFVFTINQSGTSVTGNNGTAEFTQDLTTPSVKLATAGKYVSENIVVNAEKPQVTVIEGNCLDLSNFSE